eukprot:TRINITY_DN10033_c0_g1_i2.p1 TRINITY_DN10033_c0_g1~~TRINITY_DN10033_c0_g1_i2.p1  ORF type:complete len:886 (-),score=178.83 TRINITY_DN10033_c0_g1_i2:755-3412(-)
MTTHTAVRDLIKYLAEWLESTRHINPSELNRLSTISETGQGAHFVEEGGVSLLVKIFASQCRLSDKIRIIDAIRTMKLDVKSSYTWLTDAIIAAIAVVDYALRSPELLNKLEQTRLVYFLVMAHNKATEKAASDRLRADEGAMLARVLTILDNVLTEVEAVIAQGKIVTSDMFFGEFQKAPEDFCVTKSLLPFALYAFINGVHLWFSTPLHIRSPNFSVSSTTGELSFVSTPLGLLIDSHFTEGVCSCPSCAVAHEFALSSRAKRRATTSLPQMTKTLQVAVAVACANLQRVPWASLIDDKTHNSIRSIRTMQCLTNDVLMLFLEDVMGKTAMQCLTSLANAVHLAWTQLECFVDDAVLRMRPKRSTPYDALLLTAWRILETMTFASHFYQGGLPQLDCAAAMRLCRHIMEYFDHLAAIAPGISKPTIMTGHDLVTESVLRCFLMLSWSIVTFDESAACDLLRFVEQTPCLMPVIDTLKMRTVATLSCFEQCLTIFRKNPFKWTAHERGLCVQGSFFAAWLKLAEWDAAEVVCPIGERNEYFEFPKGRVTYTLSYFTLRPMYRAKQYATGADFCLAIKQGRSPAPWAKDAQSQPEVVAAAPQQTKPSGPAKQAPSAAAPNKTQTTAPQQQPPVWKASTPAPAFVTPSPPAQQTPPAAAAPKSPPFVFSANTQPDQPAAKSTAGGKQPTAAAASVPPQPTATAQPTATSATAQSATAQSAAEGCGMFWFIFGTLAKQHSTMSKLFNPTLFYNAASVDSLFEMGSLTQPCIVASYLDSPLNLLYPFEATTSSGVKLKVPAQALKDRGNAAFKAGNYLVAIVMYNLFVHAARRLKSTTDQCVGIVNIATAFSKLNEHNHVVVMCEHALAIEPQNAKALYRLAQLCYLG